MTELSRAKRFAAALAAQDGEMSAIEIAKALVHAIEEVIDGAVGQPCYDPAVRLLTHQFAFVCHTNHIDYDKFEFEWLTEACKNSMSSPAELKIGEPYLIAHPGSDGNKVAQLISVDEERDCVLRCQDGSKVCFNAVWLRAAPPALDQEDGVETAS